MFKSKTDNQGTLVEELQNRITELENQLITVANDNGSVVIKQLPNGIIELNGVEIDNTTEVEYYNSSQATYGELTMFRIGKEVTQREMKKLIEMHAEECDKYKNIIKNLQKDIKEYESKSNFDNSVINKYKESEINLKNTIQSLKNEIKNITNSYETKIKDLINRYDGLIEGLEQDIKTWKDRYLKINNITLDGNIITPYGEVLNTSILDINKED